MSFIPVLSQIAEKVLSRLEVRKDKISIETLKGNLKPKAAKNLQRIFPTNKINVIAEIKRASPSEGEMASDLDIVKTAEDYLHHGAAALSILTEQDFFKGSYDFLAQVRNHHPHAFLIMKDFVLEEYQILEGLQKGADGVLLIMALLGAERTEELFKICLQWGIVPFVEVHDENELASALKIKASFIGVNNRNLKNMRVDTTTSEKLIAKVPHDVICVSESGLNSGLQLVNLSKKGYRGFLIGTHFMKSGKPGEALEALLQEAQEYASQS